MSSIIKLKKKDQIYIYDSQSYWDKEKKQPRTTMVYRGKEDPKTGAIIPPAKNRPPKCCKDYGVFYFLNEISKKIKLQEILKEIFVNDWEKILTCVFFEISEGKPLYLCNAWLDNTCNTFLETISSQRISELLKQIGEDVNNRIKFLSAWAKERKDNKFIIFDITSISSYSKLIESVEWGYNREGENLPQINLGIIFGEPSSLPVSYNTYQGSIKDVSTIKNILTFIKYLGLKNVIFVLDKGYYSEYNLKEIMQNGMKFIIPLPFTTNLSKELIKNHGEDILLHTNAFQFRNSILFRVKDRVTIGSKVLNAYIYFDEELKVKETQVFLKKVIDIEMKIKEICIKGEKNLEKYLSETYKGWKKIFTINKVKNKLEVKRNKKGFEEIFEMMGKMILLTNTETETEKALMIYRRKDKIEKCFDNMKNELNTKRLRVHSQKTFEGRLFLTFNELIIYSWISKVMEEKKLYKDYTIEEMMYELKKIKMIELENGKKIITEISKKGRTLFKNFGIELPVVT